MLWLVSSGPRSDAGDKVLVSPGFGPMQFPDFGPMQRARPSMCFICYCMVCSSLGELTKLRAYSFDFGFRYSVFKRGAREDCSAHTICSAWDVYTLIYLIVVIIFWDTLLMIFIWGLSTMVFIIKLNEIFRLCFWDVSSWYQSLGLRDSGTLSGMTGLKLRKW